MELASRRLSYTSTYPFAAALHVIWNFLTAKESGSGTKRSVAILAF